MFGECCCFGTESENPVAKYLLCMLSNSANSEVFSLLHSLNWLEEQLRSALALIILCCSMRVHCCCWICRLLLSGLYNRLHIRVRIIEGEGWSTWGSRMTFSLGLLGLFSLQFCQEVLIKDVWLNYGKWDDETAGTVQTKTVTEVRIKGLCFSFNENSKGSIMENCSWLHFACFTFSVSVMSFARANMF